MSQKFLWQPLGLSALRSSLQVQRAKMQSLNSTMQKLRDCLKGIDGATKTAIESQLASLQKRVQSQAKQLEGIEALIKTVNDGFAARDAENAKKGKELGYLAKETLRSAALAAAAGGAAGAVSGTMLQQAGFAEKSAALFGGGLLSPLSPHGLDLTKLTTGAAVKSSGKTSALFGTLSLGLAGMLGGGILLASGNSSSLTCAPPSTKGKSEIALKQFTTSVLGKVTDGVKKVTTPIVDFLGWGAEKAEGGVKWLGDRGDDVMYAVLGEKNYNKVHAIYDSKPIQYLRGIASNSIGFVKNTFSMMGNAAKLDYTAMSNDIWKAVNSFEGAVYQGGALVINGFASTMEYLGVNGNYEALREMEEQYATVNSIEDALRAESELHGGNAALDYMADKVEFVDNVSLIYGTVKGGKKLYGNMSNLSEYAQSGDWNAVKSELFKLTGFKSDTMTAEDLTYINFTWNGVELQNHYERVSNTWGNISQALSIRDGYMDGDLYKVTTPFKFGKNVNDLREYVKEITE